MLTFKSEAQLTQTEIDLDIKALAFELTQLQNQVFELEEEQEMLKDKGLMLDVETGLLMEMLRKERLSGGSSSVQKKEGAIPV